MLVDDAENSPLTTLTESSPLKQGARVTRSDAQENRARILAAARDALGASPEASLNAIGKAAGVGAGTLYRHFPSREALLLAVYDDDVQRVCAAAPRLLRRSPPLAALRAWFELLAQAIRLKHGFPEVFSSPGGESLIAGSYAPVLAAIASLLEAGERDGSIRPGVVPGDLLTLMGFLWRIEPGPGAKAQARRTLDLVMAGLAASATAGS